MLVQNTRCRFQGSYVALPTPFHDGQIDYGDFARLIEWHIASGTDGLVIAGTTGEAATLSEPERAGLFAAAVAITRRRVPILGGVGTNCTRTTLEAAQAAVQAGVDGLLVVTPYYNKPSRRGQVLHFSAVAQACRIPIVLYNVPGRTGIDMSVEAVQELGASHPHIVAIKEAKPDLAKVRRLVQETQVAVLCGEDAAIADFMGLGAVGVIGVVANLVPAKTAELVRAALPGGDHVRAARLVEELAPLARDLFLEANPVPVKTALARMGRIRDEVRLPLCEMESATLAQLESTLRHAQLIG
jgi:4-hydroxy-tetrahydrodipicolinate synthase